MSSVLVIKLKSYYSKYLGKKSLEEYLDESRKSKIGDEEKVTDSLFEWLLKDKDLWNYSDDKVLLQQQQHKAIIGGKKVSLKPDFETNNEFCKISILFDAKASNIPYTEMTSGVGTVYDFTFKRYLVNIKPVAKYILGFNLEYIILYSRNGENDVQVLAAIDVKKLFKNDIGEIERFEKLLGLTKFEELNNEEKIKKLIDKKLEKESIFNIDLFVKKFKNTQNGLYSFFLERLQQLGMRNIPDEIQEELSEFRENEKDFFVQLANRLTLIEFFKYIFIRTYEDFQLIHKVDDVTVVPITFGDSVAKIQYENLDEFRQKYINAINKTSFKDIGEEFFQGFSTLFNKYENFIRDYILEGDSAEEEFDKEYYNRLFDILFFLNEFYFGGLESEGDDIIGRLYETSLERADRKKFGQFYTPRYIIDFILDELHIVPGENKKILDLSCGTGGFLMKYLSRIKGDILMYQNESHLKNIFQGTYGIDIKMFSTLLTKLNLALIFIIKNKFLIERKLGTHKLDTKNIITGDGLEINKEESKKLEKGTFDYVVGNPPYVGIKGNADIVSRVKEDWTLSQYFTSKPDLYYFFIIHGIEKLKAGGKFGYIFPREWMTADFGNKLRGYILEHTKILKLIDLNGISIFEDAGTTSCLLFLEKVSEKIAGQTFDFIQFHNYEGMNIIKFVDENSEQLQTKTTDTKKQKVLSGFEVFSQKIIRPENFDKIIARIKKGERYDISRLHGFTNSVVYLDDFIDVKVVKQDILSESPWLFGTELPKNNNIVTIDSILSTSQGILTAADSVTKSHYEKGFVSEDDIGKGIYVLEEEKAIRGAGLEDIRTRNGSIRKIEINLYENGGWVELSDVEKNIVKPLYYGKDFEKWHVNKTNNWIIYSINKEIAEGAIKLYLTRFLKVIKNSSSNAPYGMHRGRTIIPFEDEKIVTISRGKFDIDAYKNKLFTYLDGIEYSGTNYIFINTKNPYTKTIEQYSSRKEYLKFVNAMLNSKVLIDYIKENKFNDLSGAKLSELKIPKINFEDSEQVTRYKRVVELANMLIELYAYAENRIPDLTLTKNGKERVEIGGKEYTNIMASRDFEVIDDILFIIKIDGVEYYGFDAHKGLLEEGKKQGKSLGEIFRFGDTETEKKIQKINAEIDTLAHWFYYANNSIPPGYKEEAQIGIFTS